MPDGLQVPLIPFVEVVGNDGAFEYLQSGPIAANSGVTLLEIVTALLPVDVHPVLFFTVVFSVTEPEVPAVYLMLLVPLPDVMVPLLMVHV